MENPFNLNWFHSGEGIAFKTSGSSTTAVSEDAQYPTIYSSSRVESGRNQSLKLTSFFRCYISPLLHKPLFIFIRQILQVSSCRMHTVIVALLVGKNQIKPTSILFSYNNLVRPKSREWKQTFRNLDVLFYLSLHPHLIRFMRWGLTDTPTDCLSSSLQKQ